MDGWDNLIADIEGSQKLGAIALQKINHKSELNFDKIKPDLSFTKFKDLEKLIVKICDEN